MNITFVLGYNNPKPSASWERIYSFATNWVKKGHIIDVVGVFSLFNLQKKSIAENSNIRINNCIPTISLGTAKRIPFAIIINFFLTIFYFSIVLLTKKVDLIIISMPTGDIGLGAVIPCILLRKKYIIDYRDEWEDYAIINTRSSIVSKIYEILRVFATYCYKKSIVISTVTVNIVNSLSKRGLTNIIYVPNGANIKVFKPSRNKSDSKFKIVYVGQIGKYYRIDIILDSLSVLIKKGYHNIELILVGWGEVREVLLKSKKLGIIKNIKYLGTIYDKNKLAQIISSSQIGIIPFSDNAIWSNALPTKFFEYAACGVPTIATISKTSVLSDIILSNGLGKIVPSENYVKLADAIEFFYDEKDLLKQYGKNARVFVMNNFDREIIASSFIDIIKKMI